jgi:hypothetical protein
MVAVQPHSSQNGAVPPSASGSDGRPGSNGAAGTKERRPYPFELEDIVDRNANGNVSGQATIEPPSRAVAATNGAPAAAKAGGPFPESFMDPCAAGQVEACAVLRITEKDQAQTSPSYVEVHY